MYDNQLKDIPDIFEYLGSEFTGDVYTKALSTLQSRMEWQRWKDKGGILSTITFNWGRDITTKEIDPILKSYANILGKSLKYEEYSAYKALSGDNLTWTLIKEVAQTAGQPVNLTREVLDHLEAASRDGSITTYAYWKPRTYMKNVDNRTTTPEAHEQVAKETATATGSIFGTMFDISQFLLKNIIPITVIGGGIYVAKKTGVLDKGFSAIKKKVGGNTVSDDLFGGEFAPGPTFTLYEIKENGHLGITTNINQIKEKFGVRKIKVIKSSKDYDLIKKEQSKYLKTDAMF